MIRSELPPSAPISNDQSPKLASSIEWRHNLAALQNVDIDGESNIRFPVGIIEATNLYQFCDALGLALSEQVITEENMPQILDMFSLLAETQSDPNDEAVLDLQWNENVQAYLGNRYADLLEKHDELVAVWPKFIEIYEKGMQNGIDQGYLPPDLLERFRNARRTTGVQIMDGAAVQTQVNGITAAYSNDEAGMFLDHQQHPSDEEYIEDLAHEFGHDTSGGTYTRKGDAPGRIIRKRVGLATEIAPGVFKKTGLNEAINHHATLGILTGDFENLNPAKREDQNSSYLEERMIYGVAVDNSCGLLTVKDLTLGLYEQTGPGGGLSARKKMLRGFRQAYGFGAIKKLEYLCEMFEETFNGQPFEPMAKTLGRIHPPMVDENGVVAVQGYIDMTNLPDLVDMVMAEQSKQAA